MSDKKYQAKPAYTRYLTPEDFQDKGNTAAYWLTSAGVMINSHGTVVLIDPVLGSIDGVSEMFQRLLTPTPIQPGDVPKCHAVLYTHADHDHMSEHSAGAIQGATEAQFYVPSDFVLYNLKHFGIARERRNILAIGETLKLGCLEITRTPAHHDWQRIMPNFDWAFEDIDCAGYYIKTPDGNIWITGDTELLPEHLEMTDTDLIFLDFCKSHAAHFGFEDAIKLANTLTKAQVVIYHWGTFALPDFAEFNADPEEVRPYITNPERFISPIPGEAIILNRK